MTDDDASIADYEKRFNEALFLAGVDLVGRTGAKDTQIRYSDDEEPTVWFAVARYGSDRWETAAGRSPTQAVIRLCEALVDGGTCAHCDRPTGVSADFDEMPLDELVCWYQYDPELQTFRRSCEGA